MKSESSKPRTGEVCKSGDHPSTKEYKYTFDSNQKHKYGPLENQGEGKS